MGDPRTPRRPPPFARSVSSATVPGLAPTVGVVDRAAREDHNHGSVAVGTGPYVKYDLSAQCNGVLTVFTTPTHYVFGTLEVLINGLDQGVAGVHFSETTDSTFTVLGA